MADDKKRGREEIDNRQAAERRQGIEPNFPAFLAHVSAFLF
jgi:hypothetical protein